MAHMSRLLTTVFTCLCMLALSAQPWTRNITSEEPTFFDVQQAFTDYWEPFNVEAGWYTDDDGVRRKAFGWNQFERWAHYWESRVGPTGRFPTLLAPTLSEKMED